MSKRSVFTTITPLPPTISRETVLEFLHDHTGMIDLNPLVQSRCLCEAPDHADEEERQCLWYKITDKIAYLPGGLAEGAVTFYASFHDLHNGLQTHSYAPMGVNIKGKWTIGGSLPGEPKEAAEIGVKNIPKEGLYLREDVDLKCNMLMTGFVKKDLKKSHEVLVSTLIERAHAKERASGRQISKPETLLPPAYDEQQSMDQKPRPQSGPITSFYEPPKQGYEHPLKNSGVPYNGQGSSSQISFQSARSHQTPPPASNTIQKGLQQGLLATYPYPQGPHSQAPPIPQQQQQQQTRPQQHNQNFPHPGQSSTPPQQQRQQYQPVHPSQHHQQFPSQSQGFTAEMAGDMYQPGLVPEPLRAGRTGNPHRPAEMQG